MALCVRGAGNPIAVLGFHAHSGDYVTYTLYYFVIASGEGE
jgi:hypothetical protein